MLMMRMHGLGAVATAYGDPGDAANAPGSTGPMGAQHATGGGGPIVVAAIRQASPAYTLSTSMSINANSPPMQVQNLPSPTGPNGTGISILCPPGTALDPGSKNCIAVAPPPQTCPTGTTFEATTSSCISPSGVQTPVSNVIGACPTGYSMGADGACYAMQADPAFTVPTWGWLAGLGVAGYLAYHFFIAK